VAKADDRSSDQAVILEIESAPDPWAAGRNCTHSSTVTNMRAGDILDLTVISKSLYNIVDFVGAQPHPNGRMPGSTYEYYPIVGGGGTAPETYPLRRTPPAGGAQRAGTDKILTTAVFVDSTNQAPRSEENLAARYNLNVP
jgi:hypothetical protein